MEAIPVSDVAKDESLPWEMIMLMDGTRNPVTSKAKFCRVFEFQDGTKADELWLYIRKSADGNIKYAFTNAPADIDVRQLHHAAALRWPMKPYYRECWNFLGMSHYETRSYLGWHRHMLLVMVAHLFVLELRIQMKKRQNEG